MTNFDAHRAGTRSVLRLVHGGIAVACAGVVSVALSTGAAADTVSPVKVTVTLTPTLLVSKDAAGNLVTLGTVYGNSGTAASTDSGSSGALWVLIGVIFLIVAGTLVWTLLSQNRRRTGLASVSRSAGVAGESALGSAEAGADDDDPTAEPAHGSTDDPGAGDPLRRLSR